MQLDHSEKNGSDNKGGRIGLGSKIINNNQNTQYSSGKTNHHMASSYEKIVNNLGPCKHVLMSTGQLLVLATTKHFP